MRKGSTLEQEDLECCTTGDQLQLTACVFQKLKSEARQPG